MLRIGFMTNAQLLSDEFPERGAGQGSGVITVTKPRFLGWIKSPVRSF